MGVGRFVCVAIPFALTFASLVCMLIAGLSGITNQSNDLFKVNTTDLSISSSSFANLADLTKRGTDELSHMTSASLESANSAKRTPGISLSHLTSASLESANSAKRTPGTSLSHLTSASLENAASSALTSSGTNITAADLSLADAYTISVWGYCSITGTNTTCTKGKFNWAASVLNTSTITTLATNNGVNATLPAEVTTALKTFIVVAKWTEIVYIIAIVALALELLFGVLAFCSSCGSCITWLLNSLSTFTVVAASVLATVMSSVVTATLESTAKAYGVTASINTKFLATTWLGVAFSIGAGLFWFLTICCCKVDHRSALKNKGGAWGAKNVAGDQEKYVPPPMGNHPYQKVLDPNDPHNFGADTQYYGQVPAPQTAHKNGNYEPYARGAI